MKKGSTLSLVLCLFAFTTKAEWRVYKSEEKSSASFRSFAIATSIYDPGTNTYTVNPAGGGTNYDTNAPFTYRAFARTNSSGAAPTILDPLALTPYTATNSHSKGLILMNVNPDGTLFPSNQAFVIDNGIIVDTNYWSWAEIELPDVKTKQFRVIYRQNGIFLQDQAPKGNTKIEVFTGSDVIGKFSKNKTFAKVLMNRTLGDVDFSQDPDANVDFDLNGVTVDRESLGLQNEYITSVTSDGFTRYIYNKKASALIANKTGAEAITALLDVKPIKGATPITDPVVVPTSLPPFWRDYWFFTTLTNWPGGTIDLDPPFNNGYDDLGGTVNIN